MKVVHLFVLCVVVLLVYFTGVYMYLREENDDEPLNPLKNRRTVLRPPDTFDPVADCVTPFGTRLGVANDTPAFSNCASIYEGKNVGFFSFKDPYDISDPVEHFSGEKMMTAARWNAMEYVIRWFAFNRGVVPQALEDLAGMWGKNYFYHVAKSHQEYDAAYIVNYHEASNAEDIAYVRPRPGDVIIYYADYEKGCLRGHLAVIVAVENDVEGAGGIERYKELAKVGKVPRILYLAEQNFDNKPWEHGWYARTARFKWREPTSAGMLPEGYIEDDSGLTIMGRMRIGAARPPRREQDNYGDALNERVAEDDDL